ncbi:MAG TPA: alpha/beta hydrolase, partial [Desulfobacteraceae bacterium]|nr:alpha/beta hydrolase [Desulfobacteraceae bacterium]
DRGYTLDDGEFLERLKTAGQGILIAEGREPMKNQSLILEIEQDMITILESTLNLSIDSVETMFRYRNLRPSLGASGGGPDRDDVTNFPDDPENDSDVVFIHGYNVTAEKARGWHSEIFKRLFWSGSKARFHGVTWYGDQGLVFKTLRYYADVTNAFHTSEHFADYINEDLKGDVTVMAHSAGNIVASAAIHDHGASVDRYYMFNAPLSKEVFLGESQAENPGLIHAAWRQENNKYNAVLYASEWSRLFGDSDSRSKLTWRDRFKNVTTTDVINFYSETDNVLHDFDREGTSSPPVGYVQYARSYPWCIAQLTKGRSQVGDFEILGVSVAMGWGFNGRIYPDGWAHDPMIIYTAGQMDDVIAQGTDILKPVPFFSPAGMEDLFEEGEAGSGFAEENHARIMAYGIPARDYAVGANYTFPGEEQNENMIKYVLKDANDKLIWPSNRLKGGLKWWHSDIRDVAYVYNYTLFDAISGRGVN